MSNSRSLAKLPAFLSPAGVLSPQAGGTGVTSLNAAVGALGLTIGTDVQAYDADLGSIAGLTGTAGLLKKTATNTWTLDTSAYLTGITSGQVTTALGFTPYNSSNPSGYISGITSSNVTTALGFTPYNSTNPNAYISGITSSNVTTALGYTPENSALKGSANGYASLDGSGLVPSSQLPSYVDDVLEYANLAGFPATGTTGKIYVALDTNKTYRWSGSAYVYITSGAVDSVAGRTGVVSLTSSDVGLGNVENKSSATIRSEISSANVTGALGFTPYNATNPSGYITTSALSGYLTSATAANTYQPIGSYLTGITSSQVTTALGFTPYNSSNPSGYITSSSLSSYLPLTGGSLTGSLSITGNASYVGNWGYSTLVLQDASGYPGLNFRSGNNNWIFRMQAGSSTLNWAYSSNASAQGTGTYTEYLTLQTDLLTHPTSIRSPIFYDSGDTSYYIDPASQSLLNRLKVSGGNANEATQIIEASVYPMLDFISTSTDTNNRNWRIAGVYNSYGLLQILSSTSANGTPSTARLAINGSSGYVGIGAAATGPANHFQIGSMGSTGYSGNHFAIGNGTQVFAQYVNGATSVDFYTNSGYFNFDKYIQASGSIRGPLFYDSNDTAYYVNPNGSSVLDSVTVNSIYGTINGMGASGNAISGMGTATTWDARPQGYNDRYAINYHTGISLSGYPAYGGVRLYSAAYPSLTNSTLRLEASTGVYTYGQLTNDNRVDAPIFYDYNNTAYYVNPNSTSVLNALTVADVTAGSLISTSYVQLNGPIYRAGPGTGYMNGQYPSSENTTTSGPIYSIGGPYVPTATTLGNMYGIGFTYAGVTGGAGALTASSSWGLYVATNGTARVFLDSDLGRVLATGDMRAPIFYDSDNTGYYVDPNSTSNVNQLRSNGLSFISDVSVDNVYGMYFDSARSSAYAIYRAGGAWTHPYPDLRIAMHTGIQIGANASYGGVRFYTDYDMGTEVMSVNQAAVGLGAAHVYVNNTLVAGADLRAPLFYDSNNTGYYVDPASTTNLNAVNVVSLNIGGQPVTGGGGGSSSPLSSALGYSYI